MKERIMEMFFKAAAPARRIVGSMAGLVRAAIERMAVKYPLAVSAIDGLVQIYSWLGRTLEPAFKSGKETYAYLLLYFVALGFFFLAGFDASAVNEYAASKIRNATGMEFTSEKASFAFPVGMKFEGVRLSPDDAKTEFTMSSVKARLLFLPLLTGKGVMRVTIDESGGTVYFDIAKKLYGDENVSVVASARTFPIDRVVTKEGGKPFPVKANVTADGNLAFGKSLAELKGEMVVALGDIKIVEGAIGEGLVNKLSPKSATCTLNIGDRKLATKECVADTPLGKVALNLNTTLADKIDRTPFIGSVVITKPTGFLEAFLQSNPRHRKPDGTFVIPLKGSLSSPSLAF